MRKYIAIISLLAFALAASAQENVFAKGAKNFGALFKDSGGDFYKAGQLDLSLGGLYSTQGGSSFQDVWTSEFKRGTWGIDIGGTYWLTKNFGVGAEVGLPDLNHPNNGVFEWASGDFYARVPIKRFAPYAVVGGGNDWTHGSWFTDAGAGVQYAISQRVKLDTGAKFRWMDDQGSNQLILLAKIVFSF
jgi:hypothetical protein